jgi:hypothetical protein
MIVIAAAMSVAAMMVDVKGRRAAGSVPSPF